MIYPQSFPNLFSSFADEQMYEVLSSFSGVYDSFYGTIFPWESNKYRFDYLEYVVIDKNQGILIIATTSKNLWIQQENVQHPPQFKDLLENEFKKMNLSDSIVIKTAVLQTSNTVNTFKNWFDSFFETEKSVISDSDFKKIIQYLKKNNLFYTPSGKLQEFNFQNFKGIKHTHINNLPITAPWIFLTGENGFGKTCLLQAIAVSLYGQNPDGQFDKSFDFSFSASTMSHEGDSTNKFKMQLFAVTKNLEGKSIPYFYPKSKKIETAKSFRNICAYGASRLDTYDENNSKKNDTPILSLFDTKSLLRNIEINLRSWYLSDITVNNQKFEKTKLLLEKLLDGIEISISKTSQRVWYTEKKEDKFYEPITFDNLAAGYRSMIAMVGDIIIRLFDAQPDVIDPAELEGIVIIDELDLHWHPKWQKKIPSLLTELFPLVQFIASTHSPIPLLGAPEHSVFLKVNRTVEDGITVTRLKEMEQKIKNLLPNIILTSPIFDMDDIKAVTNKDISLVNIDESFNDEKFYDIVNKKIAELFLKDKIRNDDSNKKKPKK